MKLKYHSVNSHFTVNCAVDFTGFIPSCFVFLCACITVAMKHKYAVAVQSVCLSHSRVVSE